MKMPLGLHIKHKRELRLLWEKAIGGTKLHANAYHQTDYIKEIYRGYMVAPKKRNEDMRCMKKLDGGHLWGYVNKDKIRFFPEIEAEFTDDEWNNCRSFLDDYLSTHTKGEYHKKALNWFSGTINFVPRWMSISAVRLTRLVCALDSLNLKDYRYLISPQTKRVHNYSSYKQFVSKAQHDFIMFVLDEFWTRKNGSRLNQKLSLMRDWNKIPKYFLLTAIEASRQYCALDDNKEIRGQNHV